MRRVTHVLALDEGTTSARAIVFDASGAPVALAQRPLASAFPREGWVEQDPEAIWSAQRDVALEALASAGLRARDVAAAGITNQRETTVVWDRASGRAIAPAIVWQDRRTAGECERLIAQGADAAVHERTGLRVDPYFSATKIAWILDHADGAREAAAAGRLAFGTVDAWLAWKLTGGRLHVTDASNASRTLLYDLRAGAWSDAMLELFRVPRALLPEVRDSSEVYAEISEPEGLRGLKLAGIAGDQQAALFGQLCIEPGSIKCTYGTGCFVLESTGDRIVESKHRLLTTVAHRVGATTRYALEGSVFIGGAVVQWLRDGMHVVRAAAEIEALARSVPDAGGVVLVPAFAGLGAPHWDPYARGAILGITRGTTAAHLARAALEGIALQVADLLDAMAADTGRAAPELRVDGGASANALLMQLQADVLGVPVVRPAVTETTALGAAYLAGLAAGAWKSIGDLRAHDRPAARFEPARPRDEVAAMRARWSVAVKHAMGWAKSAP